MLPRQPEEKQTSNLHAALQTVQIQLRTFVKILPHRVSHRYGMIHKFQ